MINSETAKAVLTSLAQGEAKNGRMLNYPVNGTFTYCPVCGTGSMKDFTFTFAATDGRDPITKDDGLVIVFYIDHPALKRRCLMGMAGAPAHGPIAEQLLGYGQALQVLALEEMMKGRAS